MVAGDVQMDRFFSGELTHSIARCHMNLIGVCSDFKNSSKT